MLLEAPSQPRGVVVLSHPYLAEARDFYLIRGHAAMYHELGFHVVVFDFNGFGQSPFRDFSYEQDLSMVVAEIGNRYPGLRLLGHGVSFGAAHTITYSTRPDNLFEAIIIENCLDSNLSYYKKRNKKLHILVMVLMKVFPGANKDHNYIKAISCLRHVTRVLFIYTQDDELTTPLMGERLAASCNKPAIYSLMKGRHLTALRDNRQLYTHTVSDFINVGNLSEA